MNIIGNEVVSKQLDLARSGDQGAFEALMEPYRHELLAHCYRILGSVEDAEDMLQETLLRAWKHLDSYEGRASLRAWLYRIATNACLDGLDSRKRRGLPRELYPRGDAARPLPPALKEPIWVEPFPDEWIEEQPENYPESRYDKHESIKLAFIAALQFLPGRQRAALLLRDVMGWNSDEAAAILGMSIPAMNSALQRARLSLKTAQGSQIPANSQLNEPQATLLTRYVSAWEKADPAALVAILREDVALTMPPFPVWFSGRADVHIFLETLLFNNGEPFQVHLIPTRANASPAFAVYQMNQNGIFKAAALHILTIEDNQIAVIDDFLSNDGRFFTRFGLPLTV
jgi:RNA polymerase sigma-70 factor, ECF subfamily